MHAVADRFHKYIPRAQTAAHKAEFQMMHRRQHIAEMRQMLHARRACRFKKVVLRQRMRPGRHDAEFAQSADEFQGAGQFRRKGNFPHRADVIPFLHQFNIRIPQKFRILCARAFRRDERPFQMHAEQPRSVRVVPAVIFRTAAGTADVLLAERQGRSQKSGNAFRQFPAADGVECLRRGVGKIHVPAAMTVNVDESGQHTFSGQIIYLAGSGRFLAGKNNPVHFAVIQQQGGGQVKIGCNQTAVAQQRLHDSLSPG